MPCTNKYNMFQNHLACYHLSHGTFKKISPLLISYFLFSVFSELLSIIFTIIQIVPVLQNSE